MTVVGDAACWLGEVCEECGRIPDGEDVLDGDGRCAECRADAPVARPADVDAPDGRPAKDGT